MQHMEHRFRSERVLTWRMDCLDASHILRHICYYETEIRSGTSPILVGYGDICSYFLLQYVRKVNQLCNL